MIAALGLGGCKTAGIAAPSQPLQTAAVPATQPSSTQPPYARYEYRKVYMWMPVRLVVYAASEEQAQAACRAAYDRVGEIDDRMTDYRAASELSKISRSAGQGPVRVSEELFRVLWRAQVISGLTNGAFDITVGPVVRLWREARQTGKLPDPSAIAEAKKLVGWQKIKLDPADQTVTLSVPGMKLDLGGIAKGYAGDEAVRVLREHGVPRAFFEAGGDIVVGDAPPDREGWAVEVTGQTTAGGDPLVLYLKNAALSTSGDTEQFVEIDGKRYSHIVDPATGIGLTNRRQVNVLADNGLTSDPLSKGFSVLDGDRLAQLSASFPGIKVWTREARD